MRKPGWIVFAALTIMLVATAATGVTVELVSAEAGYGTVDYDAGGQAGGVGGNVFIESGVSDAGAVVFVTWQDLGGGDTPPIPLPPDGDLAAFSSAGGISALYVSGGSLNWNPVGGGDDRTLSFAPGMSRTYFFARTSATGAEYLVEEDGTSQRFDPATNRLLYGVDISGDGRFGAFCEESTIGQSNSRRTIFVRNLATGDNNCITIDTGSACVEPSISGDGSRVAFSSSAGDLAGGAGGVNDIFIYDGRTADFVLVSLGTADTPRDCWRPIISGDGGAVAFETSEGDYWAGADAASSQVVLWTADGSYQLCSVGGDGLPGQGRSWEADVDDAGRYVAFTTEAINIIGEAAPGQIAVYDRLKRRTTVVSRSSGGELAASACRKPVLSPNGRFLTFSSVAANLDDQASSSYCQVYRVDLGPSIEDVEATVASGQTVPLPVFETGRAIGTIKVFVETLPAVGQLRTNGNALVAAGERYPLSSLPWSYTAPISGSARVTFEVFAEDESTASLPATITLRVFDPEGGFIERVTVTSSGSESNAGGGIETLNAASVGIDRSGSRIVFATPAALSPADPDSTFDVYVRDRALSSTRQLSDETYGQPVPATLKGAIAGHGHVVFYYRESMGDGTTELVRRSIGSQQLDVLASFDTPTTSPDLVAASTSDDGQAVGYIGPADGAAWRQAILWHQDSRAAQVISLAPDQTSPADRHCSEICVSGDGTVVAFASRATNVVPGSNPGADRLIFVRVLSSGETAVGSVDSAGIVVVDAAYPSLSRHGRYLAFVAGAEGRLYVRDIFGGATAEIPVGTGILNPRLSACGRYVCYRRTGDNTFLQVYRYDLAGGARAEEFLVSNSGPGIEASDHSGGPAVSENGRFVSFPSMAADLIAAGLDTGGADMDVFVSDLGLPDNTPPVATLTEVPANEDELLTGVELTYTDAERHDVSVEIVASPSHALIFNLLPPGPGQEFHQIEYQAQKDYVGTDTFSYRVGDVYGWSSPKEVTIEVANVNDPPVWEEIPDAGPSIAEGSIRTVDLAGSVSDPDADEVLVFSVVEVVGPGGRDVVNWITIENGHELVIAPPYDVASFADPSQVFDVLLRVTDGEADEDLPQAVAVEVTNTDRPPIVASAAIIPETATTARDLGAEVIATDPDAGDDGLLSFEYQWHRNGDHLSDLDGLAVLPAAETVKGDTWRLKARAVSRGLLSDWALSDPVTISNTPPVVGDGERAGSEDDTFEIDLLGFAEDADADDGTDVLDYNLLEPLPARGNLRIVGSVLHYTPQWHELKPGDEGIVDVHFEVSDGTSSDQGRIEFTIHGENDPPVIELVSYIRLGPGDSAADFTTTNAAGNRAADSAFGPGQILVSDIDSPESAVSLRLKSGPAQGTLYRGGEELLFGDSFPVGDMLVYRPDAGAEGSDSFVIAGWDGLDETQSPPEISVFLSRFSVVIRLHDGWNSIALPLQPDQTRIDQLFSDGTGVPLYVDSPMALRRARYWAPVETVGPGDGFLLFCEGLPAGGVDVSIPGTAAETGVELAPGWHLRGGIGHQEEADPPIRAEGVFYGEGWFYEVGSTGSVAPPSEMRRGTAYWFRVDTAGEINFSLNRPRN